MPMENLLRAILLSFFVISACIARVGDVLKIIKTPGSHPTGLAFNSKNLRIADAGTDKIYSILWTSEGKCRISEESYGVWSSLGENKYHKLLI
jgi:hypothetical protein